MAARAEARAALLVHYAPAPPRRTPGAVRRPPGRRIRPAVAGHDGHRRGPASVTARSRRAVRRPTAPRRSPRARPPPARCSRPRPGIRGRSGRGPPERRRPRPAPRRARRRVARPPRSSGIARARVAGRRAMDGDQAHERRVLRPPRAVREARVERRRRCARTPAYAASWISGWRTATRRHRRARCSRPRPAGPGSRPERLAQRSSSRSVGSATPTTEATPSTSRASGGSASMRAPSSARSVTGTVSRRVREPIRPSSPGEGAIVEERAHRLGDEQRVAGRPLVDASGIVRIERGTGDLRRQLGRLGHRQPGEVEPLDAVPVRPGRCRARAHADEDHEGPRAARSTSTSTMPALDGSIQWRSSMTTTRGPDVSRIRST